MSKPIVVIWLKGVNLIQENTLEKVKAKGETSVKPHLSPYLREYQRSKFQVKA